MLKYLRFFVSFFRTSSCAAASVLLLAAAQAAVASPADRGPDVTDSVVNTFSQRNGTIFQGWPTPQAMIVLTGELDGYIEPCGCTGKENQKGGLSRRQNFLRAVSASGWPVLAVDLGGQVRRFGRQSEVKFQSIADGLRAMGYSAVGFGPDDLRLPAEELVAAVAAVGAQPTPFVSANVGLLGVDANITPRFRVVEVGGLRIGITSVLGDKEASQIRNDSIEILPAAKALASAAAELKKANCSHQILLSWATPEETKMLAKLYPQFDFVVTAGGADEPPAQLMAIPETASQKAKAFLIELGHKGMFAVAIGLFDDKATPLRSQRVPLDARWGESGDMIRLLSAYQNQLESLGLTGLGLVPIRHPTGRRFAGSAACADCHKEAYEVWAESPHAKALTTLEEQSPRRDSDPECLSCHVVGWAPQRFEPFEGGYAGMGTTPHLAHQGCENCHGPAAAHGAVERGDVRASVIERDRLRQELVLSIDTPDGKQRAMNNCLECHDLDNSPAFDFETYWPQIEHSEPKPAPKQTALETAGGTALGTPSEGRKESLR